MIRLAYLDYRATLRERKTWLAAAMLAYAVLAVPILLENPPEHVREAIADWFGDADPFAVFMFVWIDLVMNKTVALLPVILGGGVLLRERDTGVLALLAAKPISMPRYFVLRTLSACAGSYPRTRAGARPTAASPLRSPSAQTPLQAGPRAG